MQLMITSTIVVGIAAIFIGIAQNFSETFRFGMDKRYTADSLDAFCKKNTVATTMFGIGCILEALNLGMDNVWTLLAMGLIVLGAALTFWFMTGLERKDAVKTKSKSKTGKKTKK